MPDAAQTTGWNPLAEPPPAERVSGTSSSNEKISYIPSVRMSLAELRLAASGRRVVLLAKIEAPSRGETPFLVRLDEAAT
jgi:hypothetical protein